VTTTASDQSRPDEALPEPGVPVPSPESTETSEDQPSSPSPDPEESTDVTGSSLDDGASGSSAAGRSGLREFLSTLGPGPGLVSGVADDDPSGVATYSQAGAALGPALLWTVPLTLPLMFGVQEICDRTALATGDSLGTLVRRKFVRGARWIIGVLVVALIVANCLNVAADLAAIGAGMELLHLGPSHLWAGIAGVGLTAALVFGSFEKIAAVFKWLCLVLLVYVAVLVVARVDWPAVGAGVLGLRMTWNWTSVGLIVAVLGTTISPYMFFWQSAHRIEEMRGESDEPHASQPLAKRPRRPALRKLFLARVDVFIGMFASTLGMFAIMVATASTVGRDGSKQLNTAADAAKALEPIAGQWASAIFAIGFIATGALAVPILASSRSIALAGLLGKRWGFDRSVREAPLFSALIAAGTLGGIAISYFSENPVGLLVLSAMINGIAAAPFLIVVMLVARDRKIMGDFVNGRLAAVVGWLTAAVMAVAGLAGLYVTIANPQWTEPREARPRIRARSVRCGSRSG
jgi:NRAMP (natural resistance-associated macrophage protein)-like metal ion transporter